MKELLRQQVPLLAICVLSCGCINLSTSPDDPTCQINNETTAEGIVLEDSCKQGRLRLLPAVRVEGVWYGAGLDGPCYTFEGSVNCPAGEIGILTAYSVVVGRVGWVDVWGQFDPSKRVEALALTGNLRLSGATAWLSNGFQSWSQSGVLALADAPTEQELQQALTMRGDAEVLRTGTELSWWHTWVGGGDLALVAGTLDASQFKSWISVHRAEGFDLEIWLVSGGMITRSAWGITTRRRISPRRRPRAAAASVWPVGIARMPARTISAMKAAV